MGLELLVSRIVHQNADGMISSIGGAREPKRILVSDFAGDLLADARDLGGRLGEERGAASRLGDIL